MSFGAGNGSGERLHARAALVISEESCIRDLLSISFRAAGWFPMVAVDLAQARRAALQVLPDIVLIDLDSPAAFDDDWLQQLAHCEGRIRPLQTVLLHSGEQAVCRAPGHAPGPPLEATLCVRKPLDAPELMARVQRLVRPRRAGLPEAGVAAALRFPEIEVDLHQPTARVLCAGNWVTLDLPRNEHLLLEFLLRDTSLVRSREDIRGALWPAEQIELRTVDQYVRRLRRALQAVGARELVKTVTGCGYRISLETLRSRSAA